MTGKSRNGKTEPYEMTKGELLRSVQKKISNVSHLRCHQKGIWSLKYPSFVFSLAFTAILYWNWFVVSEMVCIFFSFLAYLFWCQYVIWQPIVIDARNRKIEENSKNWEEEKDAENAHIQLIRFATVRLQSHCTTMEQWSRKTGWNIRNV